MTTRPVNVAQRAKVAFRLDQDVHERLKIRCLKNEVSVQEVLEELVLGVMSSPAQFTALAHDIWERKGDGGMDD